MSLDHADVLPNVIAARAAAEPDRPYLVDVAGGSRTYGEVHQESLRWATVLAGLGVSSGSTVLSMLPTSFLPVEVWLGCAWLRALEVPINTDYRGNMLRHIVTNSQARVLVVAERYLDRFTQLGDDLGQIEHVVVAGRASSPLPGRITVTTVDELLDGAAPSNVDDQRPAPWDISTILYTSGTTGPSKGVLVPWAQLHATSWTPDLVPLTPDDAHYVPYPLFHVSGKSPLYAMALAGGRVVLRERWNTEAFWPDIKAHGCTSALLMSATAEFIDRAEARPDDADNPLRDVLMAPMLPNVEEFKERFGVRVRTVFNMTEVSSPIQSSWDLVNERSCGRVRPGYEARVVDEHDLEVPPGELGELIVRAEKPWVLMVGYWAMPEATAKAWRNGWLHTGDGFTRDADGNFYFVDRQKDAIRRRGENISSFEVEREVNAHPAVMESAAIAVPDDIGGDEIKVVVVPRPGASLDPAELIEFVAERAPRFMVPRYVEVVDELPKTPTSKVRKAVLREGGINDRTWDRQRPQAQVGV